jgi:hypothetical protein
MFGYIIVAAIQNDGVNPQRVLFFGIVAAANAAVTTAAHVVFVIQNVNTYSVMPAILFRPILNLSDDRRVLNLPAAFCPPDGILRVRWE